MPQAVLHHVAVSLGLFALWVILSGMLDGFHLGVGLLCAVAVSLLSARRLYTEVEVGGRKERRWLTFLPWHRIALYMAFMLWEIVKANLAVARLVLGPLEKVRPTLLRIKPGFRSELSRVVLGNSIILTPGTTVLDVTPEGELVIHALDADAARGLLEGPLLRRVAWAFEPPGERP